MKKENSVKIKIVIASIIIAIVFIVIAFAIPSDAFDGANTLKIMCIILAVIFVSAFWFMFVNLITEKDRKEAELKDNKVKTESKEVIELKNKLKQQFLENNENPELNTVEYVNNKVVFSATGKYVIENNFKEILGNHFAFEIQSAEFKSKPEDYEDVCDYEHIGFTISVGYHDGEPLEEFANDSGIVLEKGVSEYIGKVIELDNDSGYKFAIATVEEDECSYGLVKILSFTENTITITFIFDVPYGLNDFVVGTVELQKDKIE